MTASSVPCLMIAAPSSGSGKTTVTAVVLRALTARGLRVQPFKLGPDFIDPAYHAEVTGRRSINLDLWLMGADGVRDSFRRWSDGADICVIESMGALFDGESGTERGSAAQLAKILGTPVVLAIDVWGMTRTTAAVLQGMIDFDPEVDIAGCVLNRTGSQTHEQLILDAVPDDLRERIVGAVRHDDDLVVPERHLGLVTVEENAATLTLDAALLRASDAIDVDRLLSIARTARPLETAPVVRRPRPPRARLAVARDQAFCFYYAENLEALHDAGFEIVPFAPTRDPHLPAGTDAVYLGGGYPESFAAELQANASLASDLQAGAAAGLPIYAECGGLMYLARSLTGFDGTRHRMSGVLPLDIAMDRAHLAIRYVDLRTLAPSPLGPAGIRIRGQEFHQSRIVAADIDPDLYASTAQDGRSTRDGYCLGNVAASYLHLHFASNPSVPANLVQAALTARAQ